MMASFQPDQLTPRARHVQSERGRASASGSQLPLRDVSFSFRSNRSTPSTNATVTHHHQYQQQQEQLEEMKLRQQLLEDIKLKSLEQENQSLRTEVNKVQAQLKDPEKDKKQRIPSDLTQHVRQIHKSLTDDEQYDAALSMSTSRNTSVRDHLVELLLEARPLKYSTRQCKAAATNLYNSVRRNFRECQPDHENRVELQQRARKKRARQQRKYNRRKRRVRPDEKKHFSSVAVSHMTEEESDGEGGFTLRHIPWRSEAYNQFIAILDDRANAERPVGAAAFRCSRQVGSPSTMTVPDNLPQWMIETNDFEHEQCINNSINWDESTNSSTVHIDERSESFSSTPRASTPDNNLTPAPERSVSTYIGVTQALIDDIAQ